MSLDGFVFSMRSIKPVAAFSGKARFALSTRKTALLVCALLAVSAPAAGAWKDDILAAHNAERAEAQVPPLAWNDELASQAQSWAEFLAETRSAQHSPGWMLTGEGENIFVGCGMHFGLRDMLAAWRNEKRWYHGEPITAGQAEPATGHYTQMVWRNTQRVGCSLVTVSDKAYGRCSYLVCRYSPPGNIIGQRPH